MEFVSGLPQTQRNHDAMSNMGNRGQANKSAHFIAIRMDYALDRFAKLYINEIVRLHVSRPKTIRECHPHLPFYVSEPTNLNPNFSTIINRKKNAEDLKLINEINK